MTVADVSTREQLLTIDQAAAVLAVNVRMIRQLIETRRIAFVKVGRLVRIRESEIHRFIEAGTVEPIPQQRQRWR
jgi:excisionase family DNA binding protein